MTDAERREEIRARLSECDATHPEDCECCLTMSGVRTMAEDALSPSPEKTEAGKPSVTREE